MPMLMTSMSTHGDAMKANILMGLVLILIGLIQIIFPDRVSKAFRDSYKHSPLIRNEKQLSVRRGFVRVFGIVWVLVGMSVVLFK